VVPAVWLTLGDRLLNPDFVDRFQWSGEVGPWVIGPILVVVFIGVGAWDIIDGFIKARRSSRALPQEA
jgi:hypothetical protein